MLSVAQAYNDQWTKINHPLHAMGIKCKQIARTQQSIDRFLIY